MGDLAGAFREALARALDCGVSVTAAQAEQLVGHYLLLQRWNLALNLTSVTEFRKAVVVHYAESLFMAWRLPEWVRRVLDWGSGAGFPGIPIAVVRPECFVWLVEARAKKVAFLKEATRGLTNVRVHWGRAEELGEKFDIVVSRAVNSVAVAKGARMLAPMFATVTGQHVAAQLAALPGWKSLDVVAVPARAGRVLVLGEFG